MIGAGRDRLRVQAKTRTRVATGYTEVWADVEILWGQVIPADVQTRARYAQLQSDVTHTVLFRGVVDLTIGTHRLIWETRADRFLKIVEPISDPGGEQIYTTVAVQEVAAWPSV